MSKISSKVTEFAKRLQELEQEWESLKQEVDEKFDQMELQLEAIKNGKASDTPDSKVKSPAHEQSGNFPYPVGEMVRAAFPELFKRKLISAGDVAYLLSERASKDFKMRGNLVLRIFTTDDDPGLVTSGHRRYYKGILLPLGTKQYHLSSQFFPESREAVLKWVCAHGLKKNDLVTMIKNKRESLQENVLIV